MPVDDGDRSQIREYDQVRTTPRTSEPGLQLRTSDCSQISKYSVGDSVKVIQEDGSRDGPYLVASVPSPGVYTLSWADGQEAYDGEEIEENDLEAA